MSMWNVHDFSGHSVRYAINSSFAENEKEQNQMHKCYTFCIELSAGDRFYKTNGKILIISK